MESTALARHVARILEKGLGEHISEDIPHLGRAVHALLCLRSTGRGSIPSPGDRVHKKQIKEAIHMRPAPNTRDGITA